MKYYNFDLYEKSYPLLSETCLYVPLDSTTNEQIPISIKEMLLIMREAASMVYFVKFLNGAMVFMIWITIIEFVMVFMHAEEALPTRHFDKIVFVRRGLGVFMQIFAIVMIQFIYSWDAHDPIVTLSENSCTDDPILEATFDHMKEYLANAQSGARRVFFYLFLVIIVVSNLGGLGWKLKKLDPFYKKAETNGDQKKKQLKDPLIANKN